jgi:hypothetical protein
MSQNPADVTNPGSVNVVTEGFGTGPIKPNQPVTTGPSTNPGPVIQSGAGAPGIGVDAPNQPVTVTPSSNAGALVQAGSAAPGVGTDKPDQPITVGPSQNSGVLVEAGLASPTSPRCENTTENTVINQIYGAGTPKNVFV